MQAAVTMPGDKQTAKRKPWSTDTGDKNEVPAKRGLRMRHKLDEPGWKCVGQTVRLQNSGVA